MHKNSLKRIAPLLVILVQVFSSEASEPTFDLLIKNGRVLDGTGNPWFHADVGITGDRIVAVGKFDTFSALSIIDASGKYVCPGFIDLHSHADDGREPGQSLGLRSFDQRRRAAPNLVTQGITTVVINQDGRGPPSISQQRRELEGHPFAPNVILLVGHNTIRVHSMLGDLNLAADPGKRSELQRAATRDEIEQMRQFVAQGMLDGAFGISSGLEYFPARWAETEELIAIVREVVPFNGVAMIHERSSGADPMWYLPSMGQKRRPTFLDNISELIRVADETGAKVVATHIKARGANFWGTSHAAVQMIERARERGVSFWADQYPYTSSGSDGNTRLIPKWVARENEAEGSTPDYSMAVEEVLADPEKTEKLEKDVLHEITRRGGMENIIVMDYPDSSFVGKSLRELSDTFSLSPFYTAIKLQIEGYADRRGGARLRGFSMSEIDVEEYARQPWTATASDAGIALPADGPVHARFYSTFPRKIREYAVEREIISVTDAVRSATSLPAQILGLRNRGLIREGMYADLVVFDLDELRDTATFFEPHQYAEGIEHVMINGEFVVRDGDLTWALPGRVITPETGRMELSEEELTTRK